MDPDGGEVLRNLPRSRPGTRSEKRAGQTRPGAAAERAAESAERRGAEAARPGGASERAAPPPPEEASTSDPVRDAAKLAVRAAGAGVQVAGAVSRELLRRLPRP